MKNWYAKHWLSGKAEFILLGALVVAVILCFVFLAVSGHAQSHCTYQTLFINGRMVVCTVCCYNGNCTTTCS